ncbi:MAG: hypothetical protein Q8R00_04845 [Candidatus Nanoarchaeia archaeon]|nr:hypothetical protein [Candidatus Nanoarchaeia archaeon]
MNLKSKALFQVFIIVFAVLVVYSPQPVEAAGQQVCCEVTRSGNACQYTTQDQCDSRYKSAATNCEQTSFCKLGCGFDSDSGRCFKNTPKSTCALTGNCTWSEGAICDVPTCQVGCCMLGSEAALTTQLACKATASQFPDVSMKFNPAITDELECINQVRSVEKGACVKADNSCAFTTRDQCPESPTPTSPQLGFHPKMLCSNPTLQTDCASQQYTGCQADKDEVYWFDSCGNPENIYSSNKELSYNGGLVLPKDNSCGISGAGDKNCGNCNFPAGTLCGLASRDQKPTFGNYVCQDLACKNLPQDNLAISQSGNKKLGESWCAFDGAVGSGKDVVGSRHFRRICINGQVMDESCRDFREEICVEGVQAEPPLGFPETFRAVGNYVEAACRTNRFQGCTGILNQGDCEDLQDYDCYWAPMGVTDPTTGQEAGACVPQVPPGLKFWIGDAQYVPSADAGDVCSLANQECTVVEYRSGAARYGIGIKGVSETTGWECVQNCECRTQAWVDATSAICRSMGDCGLNLNILGKPGRSEAFSENIDSLSASPLNPNQLVFLSEQEGKVSFGRYYSKSWARTIPLIEIAAHIPIALYLESWTALAPGPALFTAIGKDTTLQSLALDSYGTTGAWTGQAATTAATQELTGKLLTDAAFRQTATNTFIQRGGDAANVVAQEAFIAQEAAKKAGEVTAQAGTQAASTGWATFMSVVNFVMWVYLAYQLVDIFAQDTRKIPVTATCGPWIAPKGGADCEQCGKDNKPCSEYRCKSLGSQCQLINTGTENEKCVNQNPNDVNSPRILANATALEAGYTLKEDKPNGFTVIEKIKPFTKIKLGVTTDEPAICKMSLEHSKSYDEMPHFFGEQLYDYSHELQFSLPSELTQEEVLRLTNGGKYTLYVRCSDAAGNSNNKDYYINFEIDKGPDFTAPVIELTSIVKGSYISAGVSQVPLYAYLNEPASCRWSTVDTDYSNMNNNFICSTSGFNAKSIYQGLYECGTTLTGIEKDKVSTYYFRCKDQPQELDDKKRNVNEESYVFSLIGTDKLEITNIKPQGLIYEPNPVLEVTTSKGAQNGIATCGFNLQGSIKPENMVDFLETKATTHKQPLTGINPGDYDIGVACIDAAGNIATITTRFTTEVDVKGPKLTQVYTEGNILKITTDEPSTCEYSNDGTFTYGQGTPMTGTNTKTHEATLVQKAYYISCTDKFDNKISFQIYP